jgi:hypothetical protein
MVLKGSFIQIIVPFLHILGKNYSKEIIFVRFSILGNGRFCLDWHLRYTCSNIFGGKTIESSMGA